VRNPVAVLRTRAGARRLAARQRSWAMLSIHTWRAQPARTGGNLCAAWPPPDAGGAAVRAEGPKRVFVFVARRFFKDFRPGSRLARETLRSLDETQSCISLCRSPRERGGGPRVLGRAARLIEGPYPDPLARLSTRDPLAG